MRRTLVHLESEAAFTEAKIEVGRDLVIIISVTVGGDANSSKNTTEDVPWRPDSMLHLGRTSSKDSKHSDTIEVIIYPKK